ncbi:hypothetical protein [Paenibacillus silvisoli]|uniref:hypothetical protein n=1 Tax=Paenibacillus silvisoli TaxID=3110539 RepID=UPI00280551A5|nr:hypothetical protein [Paenibacillus silvisoli]
MSETVQCTDFGSNGDGSETANAAQGLKELNEGGFCTRHCLLQKRVLQPTHALFNFFKRVKHFSKHDLHRFVLEGQ